MASRPKHLDDEAMTPVNDTMPTHTPVGLYVFDFAVLLIRYHRAMTDAEKEDDSTRYAIVLKFDGEMRARCVEKAPISLLSRTPLPPNSPKWAPWARRMVEASLTHKIITIHQGFLTKSFKDVRYTYSRWACTTAAKKIIDIYTTRDPEEPQWWIEQAFLVTSGICLMLDLFHRTEKDDKEALGFMSYVQKATSLLQQFSTSSVATHGVRILLSLQQDYTKLLEGVKPNGKQVVGAAKVSCVPATTADIHVSDAGRVIRSSTFSFDPEVLLSNDEASQFNFDIDNLGYEDLMDCIPMGGGLDSTIFPDSINGLAGFYNW